MIITTKALEALLSSFKKEFNDQIFELGASSLHKIIATTIKSNSRTNTYGWLGRFPQLREWIGDRVFENIKTSSYVIENKKYEATLNVDRVDIEDDNLAMYRPMARAMADEFIAFLNRNLADLLKGGFSNVCCDGRSFFGKHQLFEDRDGKGKYSEISNIYGTPEAKGSPWFLLSLSGTLKPLIIQERTTPEFENITSTTNETVFVKDQYIYGIRYRGSFGYGFWQQAVASKEPLNPKNYEAARLMMQQFKRDGGDPLGIVPTHLIVSADNESAARKIVKAQLSDGGNSNINYDTAELIVSPWLLQEGV